MEKDKVARKYDINLYPANVDFWASS